tara:strand:+ start:1850 stop:2374 length:525 start_codon:yes stop_codon:yes gene_type:complete
MALIYIDGRQPASKLGAIKTQGLLVALLSLLLAGPASAQIYKCAGERGTTVFSERPCGSDAIEVHVQDNNAGIGGAPAEGFSNIRADMALRDLERKIRDKKSQINRLESGREKDLAVLRDRKRYAMNNLAGATWEESISTEMNAVVAQYRSSIEIRQNELRILQEELVRMKNGD